MGIRPSWNPITRFGHWINHQARRDNLTDHALNLNMELGVHIIGGREPEQLQDHLNALIDTKEIQAFE